MNHCLDIEHLTAKEINALLKRALYFKHSKDYPSYKHQAVANLFYENSTRTRVSFERAAHHLSMPMTTIDLHTSSENKGEAVEDTLKNLAAMGINSFIIRHKQDGLQQDLATKLPHLHIINAGDGMHAHPSQALLDMMTIMEQRPDISQLKVALLGDIKHSRVANSFQWISRHLGLGELRLIAPEIWQPNNLHYGHLTSNLKEGLAGADVVICLRVQKERLLGNETLDWAFYRQHYALTMKSLSYAKANAMIMHPGPINRGLEIDSEVADSPQSFILQQVTNGVFARMAILEAVAS